MTGIALDAADYVAACEDCKMDATHRITIYGVFMFLCEHCLIVRLCR